MGRSDFEYTYTLSLSASFSQELIVSKNEKRRREKAVSFSSFMFA